MKKIFLFALAAFGMLATSCLKEQLSQDEMLLGGGRTLVAQMEQDAQTKTTLEEGAVSGKYNLFWAEDDAILVPYVTENSTDVTPIKYVLKTGVGSAEGVFETSQTPASGSTVAPFAFYPYNDNHYASKEQKVNLPASYTYASADANTNAIMIASTAGFDSDTPKLQFKHMGGVVSLNIKNLPIGAKAVKLTTNKGITSDLTFAEDEDGNYVVNAVAKAADGSNNNVTIGFTALEAVANKAFYFPLPVGTYQFKVEYQNSDGTWTVVVDSKKDNELGRAKLLVMPTIDLSPIDVNLSVSDVTSVDATVKIDVTGGGVGKCLYLVQPLGFNVNTEDKEVVDAEINSQITNVVRGTDVLPSDFLSYNGSLLTLYNKWWGYTTNTKLFTPDQSVFVGLVPADNPSADNVVYEIVTLEGYIYDENSSAAVTFATPTESYSTVSVKISTTFGTNFWYTYMDEETYLDGAYDEISEEELMEYILSKDKEGNNVGTHKEVSAYSTSTTCSVKEPVMGHKYVVLVYAYDTATGKGKTYTKTISCPSIVYSETVDVDTPVLKYTGVRSVDVQITVSGGDKVKSIYYGYVSKEDFDNPNGSYKGNDATAEELLIKKLTLQGKKEIAKTNFTSNNIYTIGNLYFMQEQYLFILAYDTDGKPSHAKKVDINTATPFDEGFDANLEQPTIKGVYYTTSSSGYSSALTSSSWKNMAAVDEITDLNELNGFYQLDVDWSAEGIKHSWLCSENSHNYVDEKALTITDKKADAKTILAIRYGTTANSVTSPDPMKYHTSELKTLRDKNTTPYSAKTIYLVWETTDGKFGFMPVVPENYLPTGNKVEKWQEGDQLFYGWE